MKIFAKTGDIERSEWLELRTHGIGGSDVSIIAGLNPFRSVFQLWMEKTGLMIPEETDSEYAHFGTVLGLVVRKEFMRRTGIKVRVKKCMFQHSDYTYMLADVDGVINDRIVKWSLVQKHQLDQKRLRSEKKEIYDRYVTENFYRRFTVA